MNLITGHNLYQPSAPVASLEFEFSPGDAELLATCDAGIATLRQKNANASSESSRVRSVETAR